MKQRIRPIDCVNSNMSPFQTHHEARTEREIDEVIHDPEALLDVRANLRVGDKVTICQYRKVEKKGNFAEGLAGFCSVRISDISARAVEMVPETPPVKVKPKAEAEALPERPNELGVKRIMPAHNDGYAYAVMDASGKTVDKFRTKAEAEAFAGVAA